MPVAVDLVALTAGYVIAAGTVEVPAGGTVNHGDVALTCSGDEACSVTVADDGTATSLGGTVTAANSPLYVVQTDAMKAAEDAATAAEAAKTSSEAALAARENRAVIQTGDLKAIRACRLTQPTCEPKQLQMRQRLLRRHPTQQQQRQTWAPQRGPW